MKEQMIQEIMCMMMPVLDNEQSKKLLDTLEMSLRGKEIVEIADIGISTTEADYVGLFLTSKRIEGCSDKTISYYESTINKMHEYIGKKAPNITTDFILKSPVRRIHKIKTTKVVKDTYSDEDLELMRDNCSCLRDLAIIDMLASTGMRVGELVKLNREDVNFNERECVVLGKGDKERIVYFDARTKLHLQNYLESRSDDHCGLFVTLNNPVSRLTINAVEVRLRELGRELGLTKVHPHKFRRTLATTAIDKGMPIEQVQTLLGHQKIDTTMQYAMVKQQNVKTSHRKYIG